MLVISTPFGFSNGNSFFFFPFSSSSNLVTKSRPTLATPWTVARQASPSMGFSRQEYQSGLPFPSPLRALDRERLLYHITGSVGRAVFILCQEMASSFKIQSARLFSHSVMSNSLQPHGLQPARLPGPWDFPRMLDWVAISSCGQSPWVGPKSILLPHSCWKPHFLSL